MVTEETHRRTSLQLIPICSSNHSWLQGWEVLLQMTVGVEGLRGSGNTFKPTAVMLMLFHLLTYLILPPQTLFLLHQRSREKPIR